MNGVRTAFEQSVSNLEDLPKLESESLLEGQILLEILPHGREISPSWLSEAQKIKAKTFKSSRRQTEYTQTRKMLNRNLSKLLQLEIEDFWYEKEDLGRPILRLKDPSVASFQISIAHSQSLCAIGISNSRPFGLDTENPNRFNCIGPREKKWLHPNEQRQCEQINSDIEQKLCQIWTQKEALSKYIGSGLSLGFSKLDTTTPELSRAHQFRSFRCFEEIVSICFPKPDTQIFIAQ